MKRGWRRRGRRRGRGGECEERKGEWWRERGEQEGAVSGRGEWAEVRGREREVKVKGRVGQK